MEIKKHNIRIGDENLDIEVAYFDMSDGQKFKNLFDIWKKLNIGLGKYGRKVNIPEVISEGMFCVYSESVRFQKKIKGKGKVSFDTINLKKQRKEQIKASSIKKDLTSFGPKTEWDDLFFLDFYNNGKLDGTFNVYLIPSKYIYSQQVNKKQTMKDQQIQQRRPRFSVKEIIERNKIKPLATDVKVW